MKSTAFLTSKKHKPTLCLLVSMSSVGKSMLLDCDLCELIDLEPSAVDLFDVSIWLLWDLTVSPENIFFHEKKIFYQLA